MVDINEVRERLERFANDGGPVHTADIRALLDAMDEAEVRSVHSDPVPPHGSFTLDGEEDGYEAEKPGRAIEGLRDLMSFEPVFVD